ncbi:hypothetical protein [Micromonospora sp. NPDC005203]|uniref:hypothetical protein n=1 Tax=Micromonospora sp. NPDC005203 TaxID=3364226 RepID=UPI0036879F83
MRFVGDEAVIIGNARRGCWSWRSTGNGWLGVLQLFTWRLSQEGAEVAPAEWPAYSAAYGVLLDQTQRVDGIDPVKRPSDGCS